MMQINYNGTIPILLQAVQKANSLLNNDAFYSAIASKPGFYFTAATGMEIAESMTKCNLKLNITAFKKILSRELGYEDPNDPTSIHIKMARRKLNRSLGSIVGTYIDEAVHAADFDDDNLDYPHDSNSSKGNEDTPPYWIGNFAVQMIDNPATSIDINNIAAVLDAPDDEMA